MILRLPDGTTYSTRPKPKGELRKLIAFNQGVQGDTNQSGICRTCQPYNCSGAEYPILLGPKEKEVIYRVNPGEMWNGAWVSTDKKMQWACHIDETGYLYMAQGDRSSDWQWWYIVMCSQLYHPENFNQVSVLSYANEIKFGIGGYADIETIPVLDNYDHLTPELYPWLFHDVYVQDRFAKIGHFKMPLWSPEGRQHPTGDMTGHWVRTEYLSDYI